ncbi:hypothetical protein [Candidatus Viadribacter manganicus]|uniref:Lipoprotein n=1 Tax=Candidatus Viadribacter manganicus TaxID=1759059 RepID=A0A1B1AF28_9PROT|nr:hypothetical protein [Candidatus Viadribacter manganicus]ANP45173.1 hypothetical protein ATE48_04205 [Candidatus Viadribacter manganicus]
MRIVVALTALVLAACTQQPVAYTPDVERNFMTACEIQGASNALCGCTWDRIEADIPPDDFAALERLPGPQREDHPMTAQINGYVEACNASLATESAPSAEDPVPAP